MHPEIRSTEHEIYEYREEEIMAELHKEKITDLIDCYKNSKQLIWFDSVLSE
jgi:hypothetical protein